MLTGDTRASKIVTQLKSLGWGRIWIDRTPTPFDGEPWGFDNGAFRDWRNGRAFDEARYQKALDKAYKVGCPYITITPDLVTEGLRSLEFSLAWRERLPDDWPWFLAVQDGMGISDVESVLDRFVGVFLGGSNRFKATAYFWSDLAHRHGKLFHYGRAGTRRKIQHAREVGADSADSAFPLWCGSRLSEFIADIAKPRRCGLFDPQATALHPDVFRGAS